jgi:hypothetical protein
MDMDRQHCCKSVSGRIDFNADPNLDPEAVCVTLTVSGFGTGQKGYGSEKVSIKK